MFLLYQRALLRALQGGCKVPITVRSTWSASTASSTALHCMTNRCSWPVPLLLRTCTDPLSPPSTLRTALSHSLLPLLRVLFIFGCVAPHRRKWSDSECELCLWSAVLSVDGRQSVEFESSEQFNRSTATESQLMQAVIALGERVGHQLRATGAEKILADIR